MAKDTRRGDAARALAAPDSRCRSGPLDAAAALRGFATAVAGVVDRDVILAELSTHLCAGLALGCLDVALWDRRARGYHLRRFGADGAPAREEDTVPDDHPCVGCLRRAGAALRCGREAGDADGRACAELYQRHGWQACVPLLAAGELIGFVGLGFPADAQAPDLGPAEALCACGGFALHAARLHEELQRSRELMQRADRLSALGTLAAGIAHEIRNPLVSIQTFFQLLPSRLDDEEFRSSFLEMTASEAQRINALVAELLTFARAPTRDVADVDLDDLVDGVMGLMAPEAKKQRLALERAPSAESATVCADADQLKQVVINVVLNAIQATPAGGRVTLRVCTAYDEDRTLGRIEVRDTGVGISPEQLEQIFDPFFTTKDTGTGLGLAIAQQIVAEHGGHLTVDSVPGHGTVFHIDLPLADQRQASS